MSKGISPAPSRPSEHHQGGVRELPSTITPLLRGDGDDGPPAVVAYRTTVRRLFQLIADPSPSHADVTAALEAEAELAWQLAPGQAVALLAEEAAAWHGATGRCAMCGEVGPDHVVVPS